MSHLGGIWYGRTNTPIPENTEECWVGNSPPPQGPVDEHPMTKLGREWRQRMEDRQYEHIFGEKPVPPEHTEEEAREIVAAIRSGNT
jgi:hypothetical protein